VDGILGCVESGIDRIKRRDSWAQSKAARVLAAMLTLTDWSDSVLQYPKANLILILTGNRPPRSKIRFYVVCAGNRIREFITCESGLFEADEYLAL
jgi:hypothetical protein